MYIFTGSCIFLATAHGMQEYTFPKGWQAYAASFGVQGILLALDFSLSTYIKKSRIRDRIILLLLTFLSYDRIDATANLDMSINRYLTNHNAVQAGINYLISPFRGLAIFSLILAFMLDIGAFITGAYISRTSNSNGDDKKAKKMQM